MIVILILAAFQVYASIMREKDERAFYEITAAQPIFGNVIEACLLDFIEQRARLIHAGEMDSILIARFEQPRELHGLTF